jgi:hypothetical protein
VLFIFNMICQRKKYLYLLSIVFVCCSFALVASCARLAGSYQYACMLTL